MKRFLCLFCLLLVACAAPAPEPTATASPPPPDTPSPLPSATATEEPSPTPTPVSGLCSPLGGHSFQALMGYISQGFSPPPSSSNWDGGHHGLDFAYYQRNDPGGFGGHIEGALLQSVLDGFVAGLGYASIYGHYLIVETPWAQLPAELASLYSVAEGQSVYLMYAHLQEEAPFVLGEPLDCGQMVGRVGATGDAFFVVEPHLHLELRTGASGLRLAAMTYYGAQDSPAEQEEYRRWRNSPEFLLHDPLPLMHYGVAKETADS